MANIKMNRSTGKPQEGFPPHLDWDPYDWMRDDTEQDPAAMRQMSPLDIARKYYAETDENGNLPPSAKNLMPERHLEPWPREEREEDPIMAARRYEMESKAPTAAGRMHDSTTDRLRAMGAIGSGDVEKTNTRELPEELRWSNPGRRR